MFMVGRRIEELLALKEHGLCVLWSSRNELEAHGGPGSPIKLQLLVDLRPGEAQPALSEELQSALV